MEEEWKDVTEECKLKMNFTATPKGYMFIDLYHEGEEIGVLMSDDEEGETKTPAFINATKKHLYKLEKLNFPSCCHSFKVFKRVD